MQQFSHCKPARKHTCLGGLTATLHDLLGPTVPQGRAGTAEEVAEAVVWLLSDAARYCAGSIIDVSGGR